MTKWILGALLSVTLLFGGTLMSSVQSQVTDQGRIIYDHGQDISTLKEAVKNQTEVAREQTSTLKEIRDALVQAAKTDRQ